MDLSQLHNAKTVMVVPSHRKACLHKFCQVWQTLLQRHAVPLLAVIDGASPYVSLISDNESVFEVDLDRIMTVEKADYSQVIFNHTDACRNLGFAYIARFCKYVKTIITLDDDVVPPRYDSDPIAEHLNALELNVPISWISTAGWGIPYMRGFPYGIRSEAEVVMSHGVWTHIPDLDAETQLQRPDLVGGFSGPFYIGPIPKGVYAPISGMNVAFKRKALPYVYWAPMGPRAHGLSRWADILMGVTAKREFDVRKWAIFSGASVVRHERASDVIKNLEAEKGGKEINEQYWRCTSQVDHIEYIQLYQHSLKRWQEFIMRTTEERHIDSQTMPGQEQL